MRTGNFACRLIAALLLTGIMAIVSGEMEGGSVFPQAEASAALRDERTLPGYWIDRSRNMERILLSPEQVEQMNFMIRRRVPNFMADLSKYPETMQADEMRKKMLDAMQAYSGWDVPLLYKEGRRLSWQEWKPVKDNCGFEVPRSEITVRYAVTVERTDVRLLPVTEAWYGSLWDNQDRMQGTVLDPAEAVAVLADSLDKKYFFIQARNYIGWVEASKLAFTDREHWMRYVAPQRYFTVIADQRMWIVEGRQQQYRMGARIPAAETVGEVRHVLLPSSREGQLEDQEVVLTADRALCRGQLPYTQTHLVRQAFRLLGKPYRWGCREGGWDAPGFLAAVYRTVGLELPLRIGDQERVLLHEVDLKGLDRNQRYSAFFQTDPGTLLFLPGHVMMYLGRDEAGEPAVIHAMSDESPQVMVSRLDFTDEYGQTALSRLTVMGSIR